MPRQRRCRQPQRGCSIQPSVAVTPANCAWGKAAEGRRTPRRWRVHDVFRISRSVLDCASPLALWKDVAPDGAGNSGRGVATKMARPRCCEISRNNFPAAQPQCGCSLQPSVGRSEPDRRDPAYAGWDGNWRTTLKGLQRCGEVFDATPAGLKMIWESEPRVVARSNPGLMDGIPLGFLNQMRPSLWSVVALERNILVASPTTTMISPFGFTEQSRAEGRGICFETVNK
jgi:hypothetical protein